MFCPGLSADMQKYASGGHCLVLGDFNATNVHWEREVRLLDTDAFSKDLHIVTTDLFLHQHVTDTTRITDCTRLVLDLVSSPRESDIYRSPISPLLSSSDHGVVAIYWHRGQPPATQGVENLNVCKIKFPQMSDAVNSMDWLYGHDKVESLWRHNRAI